MAWDAVLVGTGKLLAGQPGIVALHVITSACRLHCAFVMVANDALWHYLLLQAAAFVIWFRDAVGEVMHETGNDLGQAAREFFA